MGLLVAFEGRKNLYQESQICFMEVHGKIKHIAAKLNL